MTADLPRATRLLAHFIPAADREWVLGDLIEDADGRGLHGVRRGWWLAGECGLIAAELSMQQLRGWWVRPPLRELAVGLIVDGRVAVRRGSGRTLVTALLFCGAVASLAFGAELLVGSLLAAGF